MPLPRFLRVRLAAASLRDQMPTVSASRAAACGAVAGLAALAGLTTLTVPSALAAPPSGFVTQEIGSNWSEVAGVAFIEDGRSVVWERGGRVWMVNADGTKLTPPMLDLSQEVGGWRDHGLLGVALHPNFLNNGWIYLLYVVDRHHLFKFGTLQYNPNANEYFAASIGRITRYTATAASSFTQVDPASRLILLGETHSTGIPIVHQSHGVGSLNFGEDGTLLATAGDSASYESNDFGGQVSGGYVTQALADGILAPKENVGAFRSQLVDSHCGKVLRLDPATGDGVPSNPFFDPASPRAPRSRVWALGLRNPFRAEMIPETGSHEASDGQPGHLVIGDVGWTQREEVNLCDSPALNFGWPIFEGLEWMLNYALNGTVNPDAPGGGCDAAVSPGCAAPNLRFRELLIHDSIDAAPIHVNPCCLHQAEEAVISGPIIVTSVPGVTGAGAVDFQNSTSDFVEWTIEVPATGSYALQFRYAHGAGGNRPLRISVDGVTVASSLAFTPTGSWWHHKWSTVTATLDAGTRLIRATAVLPTGPNLDALAVVPQGEPIPEIPETMPHFEHRRPLIDFVHGGQASVPAFSGDLPVAYQVGSPQSGVVGSSFGGFCAIGGSRVEHGAWPEEWHDAVLFADFAAGFVRALKFNAQGAVNEVKIFDDAAGAVIMARYRPLDDSLWTVRWGDRVFRTRHEPSSNGAPVIVASASPEFGASPLLVTLDASGSSDPEGTNLTFTWAIPGEPKPFDGAVVQHSFSSSGPQRHDVQLTVRDGAGIESSAIVSVWTDNTPPSVTLLSPVDGQLYAMDEKSVIPLQASIEDAEQEELACSWITILHHNTHEHAEPADPDCVSSAVISPVGCGDEIYFYEVELTVTDPLGLATTVNAFLSPDCKGVLECPADLNRDDLVDGSDLGDLLGAWGPALPGTPEDLDGNGVVDGSDLGELLGLWGPCP
ncbi:MAG: carbohydrate-binding protein [Phycisphaerae bacterium]|nr:carbohydrate-binding protein [Phycisphaerae bacterium]